MLMRSLVTSATTLALVILASTLGATKPACSDTVINACGKFAFWVPDDWKEAKDNKNVERTAFESKDRNLYVLVGPLPDKSAVLSDDDVKDFVDEEFDDMKVTSDKMDTLEKFNVRLLEGTGIDEGDPIVFKLLALDPGSDGGVRVVVISGYARYMSRAESQGTVDRILRSLRPH